MSETRPTDRQIKDKFLQVYRESCCSTSEACKQCNLQLSEYNAMLVHDLDFADAINLALIEHKDWVRSLVLDKVRKGDDVWLHRYLYSLDPDKWPIA